jgi:hypothetical protein
VATHGLVVPADYNLLVLETPQTLLLVACAAKYSLVLALERKNTLALHLCQHTVQVLFCVRPAMWGSAQQDVQCGLRFLFLNFLQKVRMQTRLYRVYPLSL